MDLPVPKFPAYCIGAKCNINVRTAASIIKG